ncbi:DUF6318 family protein [Arthrobacter sp. TMP15]|uniref:DUF6318 family protein n=2 Tax=unclassified Arthrobacter TaxID=235627 RepID=UPI0031BB69E7
MSARHSETTHNNIGNPAFWSIHRRLTTRAMAIFISTLLTLSACSSTPNVPAPSETENSGIASAGATTSKAAPPPTVEAAYMPATADGPAQNVPIPVLPDKAKEFSKDGLIAFAEYWYSTLGYAFETGDPDPMMAVSGPDCKTCAAMSQTVVAGHAGGKWIVGGKIIIDPPHTSFVLTPKDNYQATTLARQERVQYFNADKSLSIDRGVTRAQGDILVGLYQEGQWIALTVEHLGGSKGS